MKSGSTRIAVDAAGADLAHEVHAHGIAAEREEGAVAEREDAAIAPDEIERDGENGEAGVFAEQGEDVRGTCRNDPSGKSARMAFLRQRRWRLRAPDDQNGDGHGTIP